MHKKVFQAVQAQRQWTFQTRRNRADQKKDSVPRSLGSGPSSSIWLLRRPLILKRQRKKKGRTPIVEEGKEEDIPQPISREEIEIILPQDIMQHETIEQETPLNPLSEGEK